MRRNYFVKSIKSYGLMGTLTIATVIVSLVACSTTVSHLASTVTLSTHVALSKAVLGFTKTTSFDVYVNNNRIHLIAVGAASDQDNAIVVRYVYSDDGGQQWSPPVNIATTQPPSVVSRGNDIQLAVTGNNLVALWQTAGELPSMGPMVSAYSHDGGKTWQAGRNPAANDAGDQSHIDITADTKGYFHAVWLDDRDENGYQGVRYARSDDAGVHWQKSSTLDDSSCSCCWNKVVTTPNGAVNVLYRDMAFRDMTLTQSINHGDSWQKIGTVGDFHWKFEGCPHVGGGLSFSEINGSTVLHSVVWTGVEQKQGLYYLRSVNNGEIWSTPYKLGQMAVHADIASQNTSVGAVWDENGAEGSSVFAALSNNGGLSWSVAKQWSLAERSATHPRIVPTQQGYLLLWTEKQPSQLMSVWVK